MSDDNDNDRPGLAAEYALGTLDANENARAEALIQSDPAFAAEVERWRLRFDPLVGAIPSLLPPPGVLDSVMAAIGSEAVQPGGEIIQLRRKLTAWKRVAGAAAAIAATLMIAILFRQLEPATTPQFVAILESVDRVPAFIATADLSGAGLSVRRIGPEPAPGRTFELWAIREGAAPQSLGLADHGAAVPSARFAEKTGGVPLANILLAITDEPEGGSRNGKPSGAPIFTGRLIQTHSS